MNQKKSKKTLFVGSKVMVQGDGLDTYEVVSLDWKNRMAVIQKPYGKINVDFKSIVLVGEVY